MPTDQEIKQLIIEYLEGNILPERFELLENILEKSDHAIDLYFEMMQLDALLKKQSHEHFKPGEMDVQSEPSAEVILREMVEIDLQLFEQKQKGIEAELLKQTQAQAEAKLNEFLAMQKQERISEKSLPAQAVASSKIKLSTNSLVALAASVMIAVVLWFMFDKNVTDATATITALHNEIWENGEGLEVGTELKDQALDLKYGFAEITFECGASMLLQGPVKLDLESANGAYLKHGKLVVHVPSQAKGFFINTPSAKIIDHGTQFGVYVDSSSNSHVAVMEGLVSISTPSNPSEVFIEKGQAKKVVYDTSVVESVDVEIYHHVFVKDFNEDVFKHKYNQESEMCLWESKKCKVLDFNSMESLDRFPKQFVEFVPGVKAENINGDNALHVYSKNGSLNFSERHLFNDKEIIPWDHGRSWSFWLKLNEDVSQTIIDSVESQHFKVHVEKTVEREYSLHFYYSIEPFSSITKDFIRQQVSGASNILMGNWYHIAITMNNDRIKLFINGSLQEAKDIPSSRNLLGDSSDEMFIGNFVSEYSVNKKPEGISKGFFIDDFMFTRYVLSDVEIECLANSK